MAHLLRTSEPHGHLFVKCTNYMQFKQLIIGDFDLYSGIADPSYGQTEAILLVQMQKQISLLIKLECLAR